MSNTFKHPVLFYRTILLGLGIFCLSLSSRAQTQAIGQEAFGKNRIQYKRFDWQFYSTQNFNVYFYSGGEETAIKTAHFPEQEPYGI